MEIFLGSSQAGLTNVAPAFLSAFAAIAAAAAAFGTLRSTQRHNDIARSIATLDTIIHCNTRYSDLYRLKISASNESPSPGERERQKDHEVYFRQYWGLKSDQFDYWLAGFVDHDTFFSWFYSLALHFARGDDDRVSGTSFVESWTHTVEIETEINPIFCQFIDHLRVECQSQSNTENLDTILKALMLDIDKHLWAKSMSVSAEFNIAFRRKDSVKKYFSIRTNAWKKDIFRDHRKLETTVEWTNLSDITKKVVNSDFHDR